MILVVSVGILCLGVSALPIQLLRDTGRVGWKIMAILVVGFLFFGVVGCTVGAGFLAHPLRAWLRRDRFVLGQRYFHHLVYDGEILSRFGFDNIRTAKVVEVYDRTELGCRRGKPVKFVGIWLHYPKRPGVILEPRPKNTEPNNPDKRELHSADLIIHDIYQLSPEDLVRELESCAMWCRNVPADAGPLTDSAWAGL